MSDRGDRGERVPDEEFDFEAALAELENIVRSLDRDDVGLDEAIALFRKGVARLEAANEWLDAASGRIEEVIETSGGELDTRPLEDGFEAD